MLVAKLVNSKYNSNTALLLDAIKQTSNNWNPANLRGEKIKQTFVYSYSNKGTFFSHKSALKTFDLSGSYRSWELFRVYNKF